MKDNDKKEKKAVFEKQMEKFFTTEDRDRYLSELVERIEMNHELYFGKDEKERAKYFGHDEEDRQETMKLRLYVLFFSLNLVGRPGKWALAVILFLCALGLDPLRKFPRILD
jgi:hypothetical protein